MTEFASSWPLPKDYCPPVLGNGTIAFLLDARCSMEQTDYCRGISKPVFTRVGFRYDNHAKGMVPFGWFTTGAEMLGTPVEVRQTLDQHAGRVSGTCRFENGAEMQYTVFCRMNSDFIGIRVRFSGTEQMPVLRYTLDTKRLAVKSTVPGRIDCELDGLAPETDDGMIFLRSETPAEYRADDKIFTLASKTPEAVFYLCFGEKAKEYSEKNDWNGHLTEQETEWNAYFSKGFIHTSDETCNRACDTALYYLKVVTTPYSIPTGLFPSHWQSRYFCFDEYFDLAALLAAGHAEEARRVPEFRLSILPAAQKRYYNYGMPDSPAHYPWESGEDGMEATTDGYWQDHIFEHANVVLSCYDYWKYTGDDSALEKFYPVMRACVRYFELQHLVHDSVKGAMVGNVTDLERLGPSRSNPFMTACGIVAAMLDTAEAAEALGKDLDDARQWKKLAGELRNNLPRDDRKYLPYPRGTDTAAGMMSGIYPYPVLREDDALQIAAAEDFFDREAEFGCMLKTMGSEICTWYSAWKTMFFVRTGQYERAEKGLNYTLNTVGYFGESYESNRRLGGRPWFSTGSAAILHAVSECLFQCKGNVLKIGPAASWDEYEFLQALPGDLKIHCKVKNKKVEFLKFIPGKNFSGRTFHVEHPDGKQEITVIKP